MHLIDKYEELIKSLTYYNNTLEEILPTNIKFQHTILYGPHPKSFIIDIILTKIFNNYTTNNIEYKIGKNNIIIKQSIFHIEIDPIGNSLDKHIISSIIKEYAKKNTMNIVVGIKEYKVVVINNIDNLSYYAQMSLRRIMEEYSSTCKFILVSNQLTSVVPQLRSRCSLYMVKKPTTYDLLECLIYISSLEKKYIDPLTIIKILDSVTSIKDLVWKMELHYANIDYEHSYKLIINNMIVILLKNHTTETIIKDIKVLKDLYYILFVNNIPTEYILTQIMKYFLDQSYTKEIIQDFINTTSKYSKLLYNGTRHIVYIESYFIDIIIICQRIRKNMLDLEDYKS
jgi:replication factor C subunit 3/5